MARAPGPNFQVAQLSLKRERGACFVLLWIYKRASLAELASFCQLVQIIFTVHDVIEKNHQWQGKPMLSVMERY
jgi:hypothetical protein